MLILQRRRYVEPTKACTWNAERQVGSAKYVSIDCPEKPGLIAFRDVACSLTPHGT